MNIISEINDFTEFVPKVVLKPLEDLTMSDTFHNVSVYGDRYDGVGKIFRKGTTISRYFAHQQAISIAPLQYVKSPSSQHIKLNKVFDFSLGIISTSILESLFYLARSIYHLSMAILKEPNETTSEHLFSVVSDITQSLKHLFKAVPIVGMMISLCLFDFARVQVFKYIHPQEVKSFKEGLFLKEEFIQDAVAIDVSLNLKDLERSELFPISLEGKAELRRIQDASMLGNNDSEIWTPSQGCFHTSEVLRLTHTISSHINLDCSEGLFSQTTPMETLERVIAELFKGLKETPNTIDFSPWNGAFNSTPEANKAKIAVLAYLIQYHAEIMQEVTEVKGVTHDHLLQGAVYYSSLPVFEWLHSGLRAQETIAQTKFNLLQVLVDKQKEGESDPFIISETNKMFQYYLKNCIAE